MTGKYEKQLGGIAIRLDTKVTEYTRKYAITLLNNLVLKTPVDSGRARGSWIVSVNAPDEYQAKLIDKSGSRVIANGAARVEKRYKGLEDVIYIQSNLPYIQRLDKGWSKQAPYGFTKTAMRQTDVQFAYGNI